MASSEDDAAVFSSNPQTPPPCGESVDGDYPSERATGASSEQPSPPEPTLLVLRALNGAEYQIPSSRVTREPSGQYDAKSPCLDAVGILKVLYAPGVPTHALITELSPTLWRLLATEEIDTVMEVTNVALVSPFFVRERLLSPESDEIMKALFELHASGATSILEAEVCRREREKVRDRRHRGAKGTGKSCAVDSRRTDLRTRQLAILRNLALTLTAPGLTFGSVNPTDFNNPADFSRLVTTARAMLASRDLQLSSYNLLHTSVSNETCKDAGVLEPDDNSRNWTGKVSAVLTSLLAKVLADGEQCLMFSMAHSRVGEGDQPPPPGSPSAQTNGPSHHRDNVYFLVPDAAIQRRAAMAKTMGDDALEECVAVSKHDSRLALCLNLARRGIGPCRDCHGSKAADSWSTAVQSGDVSSLQTADEASPEVERRWRKDAKRVYDAYVCKCAHPSTQRVLGKRSSPGSDEVQYGSDPLF